MRVARFGLSSPAFVSLQTVVGLHPMASAVSLVLYASRGIAPAVWPVVVEAHGFMTLPNISTISPHARKRGNQRIRK